MLEIPSLQNATQTNRQVREEIGLHYKSIRYIFWKNINISVSLSAVIWYSTLYKMVLFYGCAVYQIQKYDMVAATIPLS